MRNTLSARILATESGVGLINVARFLRSGEGWSPTTWLPLLHRYPIVMTEAKGDPRREVLSFEEEPMGKPTDPLGPCMLTGYPVYLLLPQCAFRTRSSSR